MRFNLICILAGCAALSFFTAGCAGSGAAGSGAAEVAAMPGEDSEFPAYMEVATGEVHARAEKPVPEGGYINGLMVDGVGFQPMTHVRGEYDCLCGIKKLTGQYTKGRRDLTTGEFIAGKIGPAAGTPYLAGQRDKDGLFIPDQRAVTF
jgi:hypothetical protein